MFVSYLLACGGGTQRQTAGALPKEPPPEAEGEPALLYPEDRRRSWLRKEGTMLPLGGKWKDAPAPPLLPLPGPSMDWKEMMMMMGMVR